MEHNENVQDNVDRRHHDAKLTQLQHRRQKVGLRGEYPVADLFPHLDAQSGRRPDGEREMRGGHSRAARSVCSDVILHLYLVDRHSSPVICCQTGAHSFGWVGRAIFSIKRKMTAAPHAFWLNR
jgi:hypothetical protein